MARKVKAKYNCIHHDEITDVIKIKGLQYYICSECYAEFIAANCEIALPIIKEETR